MSGEVARGTRCVYRRTPRGMCVSLRRAERAPLVVETLRKFSASLTSVREHVANRSAPQGPDGSLGCGATS